MTQVICMLRGTSLSVKFGMSSSSKGLDVKAFQTSMSSHFVTLVDAVLAEEQAKTKLRAGSSEAGPLQEL